MHRAAVEACIPCLLALVAAFVLLRVVVRLSGARLDLRRLRQLHACQDGGVQSLAFVLTLPIFIVIVQFIVQISQLMIATMVVNYSAFAAARAASVWVPAQVIGSEYTIDEDENVLPHPISADNPVLLAFDAEDVHPDDRAVDIWEYRADSGTPRSNKFANIYTAAAMACASVAPSRDLGLGNALLNAEVSEITLAMYQTLAPSTQSNTRLPQRIENKTIYSFINTEVVIEFEDKDSRAGPTYNPRRAVRLEDGSVVRDETGRVVRVWNPQEVGWQDPITVTVTHNFALLPGPGRFLAPFLVRSRDGSRRIDQREIDGETLYTTRISAACTMTNEGFKPVVPYVQTRL